MCNAVVVVCVVGLMMVVVAVDIVIVSENTFEVLLIDLEVGGVAVVVATLSHKQVPRLSDFGP